MNMRFERDKAAIEKGDTGVEILMQRKEEIEGLKAELKRTRNGFRAQCILQELTARKSEYAILSEMF